MHTTIHSVKSIEVGAVFDLGNGAHARRIVIRSARGEVLSVALLTDSPEDLAVKEVATDYPNEAPLESAPA